MGSGAKESEEDCGRTNRRKDLGCPFLYNTRTYLDFYTGLTFRCATPCTLKPFPVIFHLSPAYTWMDRCGCPRLFRSVSTTVFVRYPDTFLITRPPYFIYMQSHFTRVASFRLCFSFPLTHTHTEIA